LQRQDLLPGIEKTLSSNKSASIYADTHAALLESALARTKMLDEVMKNASLTESFSCDSGKCGVPNALKQIAKLVHARTELKTERAAFVLSQGGYDQHSNFVDKMGEKFDETNTGLESFVKEMKALGVWNDVVVVTVSEFGRTLTTNGLGTDHAWGGNIHVLGGGIRGKQILGQYPPSLVEGGDNDVGRGRLIPSTPWEAIWKGIAEWWGVEAGQMDTVLPNHKNFPPRALFSQNQLFTN